MAISDGRTPNTGGGTALRLDLITDKLSRKAAKAQTAQSQWHRHTGTQIGQQMACVTFTVNWFSCSREI